MSKKVNGGVLVGVLAVLAMSAVTQAGPILNVAVSYAFYTKYTGAGVLPSGQYWNRVDTYTAGSVGNGSQGSSFDAVYNPPYLLYDDGTTQSTISVSGNTGADVTTGSSNLLLENGLGDASRYNGTASFTISGVADVPLGYDLVLYSYDGGVSFGSLVPPDTTYFILNGVTKTADSTADAATTSGGFTDGANYVEYSGIHPVSGNISFTFDYQAAFHAGPTTDPDLDQQDLLAMFNGFQLAQVPEPASLGLLMLGGTMLLRRRRHD